MCVPSFFTNEHVLVCPHWLHVNHAAALQHSHSPPPPHSLTLQSPSSSPSSSSSSSSFSSCSTAFDDVYSESDDDDDEEEDGKLSIANLITSPAVSSSSLPHPHYPTLSSSCPVSSSSTTHVPSLRTAATCGFIRPVAAVSRSGLYVFTGNHPDCTVKCHLLRYVPISSSSSSSSSFSSSVLYVGSE